MPQGRGPVPIQSGFGLHLVLVRERVAGSLPDLARVRPAVEREFASDRRTRQLAAMYERLLAKYKVVIEKRTAGRPARRRGRGRAARDAPSSFVAAARGGARARRGERGDAHETRPGFLELRESDPTTYSLLWKRPTGGEIEIQIAPVVPEGCRLLTPDRQQLTPGAVLVRGTLTCADGLAGKTLRIAGLETTITDVLVRVHHADGRLESHLLRPATPSVTLGGVTTGLQRGFSYVQLGFQHILLGVDHLLFVLGLLLIVANRWMLVKTITSFTVAHSITLAIATLGYASAPMPPLNAAIALSILFLGPEIVRVWRGETSFTIRHPWVVAFAFGLLHGFGFASGLSAMGLPKAEIPLALLLFNVGVEIGQVAFVVTALALVRAFKVLEVRWPRWVAPCLDTPSARSARSGPSSDWSSLSRAPDDAPRLVALRGRPCLHVPRSRPGVGSPRQHERR